MAMTLRLTEQLDQQLTQIADNLGISKNAVAINAIEAFIAQESQRVLVRQAFEMVSKRDSKILEKLVD